MIRFWTELSPGRLGPPERDDDVLIFYYQPAGWMLYGVLRESGNEFVWALYGGLPTNWIIA